MLGFLRTVNPEVLTKPKTLSQAIAEGARLRPQAYESFVDGNRSCALMSAYEATTGRRGNNISGLLFVPWYLSVKYHVPLSIIADIVDMNDGAKASREAIACEVKRRGF